MPAMHIIQNVFSLSILAATVCGLYRLKYALKRAAAVPCCPESA